MSEENTPQFNGPIKPDEGYVDEQGPILDDAERYEAVLTGFGHYEGNFGPRLVWQFQIDDPASGEKVDAAGFTSYSMFRDPKGSKTSNLIKFADAILGEEVPEEGIDPQTLVGGTCRVDVENYTKGESGITKNKVIRLYKSRRKAKEAEEKAEAEDFAGIDV